MASFIPRNQLQRDLHAERWTDKFAFFALRDDEDH
jgi:hypothetical protein